LKIKARKRKFQKVVKIDDWVQLSSDGDTAIFCISDFFGIFWDITNAAVFWILSMYHSWIFNQDNEI